MKQKNIIIAILSFVIVVLIITLCYILMTKDDTAACDPIMTEDEIIDDDITAEDEATEETVSTSTGVCFSKQPANSVRHDILVGKFDGHTIDTLIAEPYGEYIDDEIYGGYDTWEVKTAKNSVKPVVIPKTYGINFVSEGDLNGDGKEEWGFITQWPTSNWTAYNLFTNVDGEWQYMIEPTSLWLSHLMDDNETIADEEKKKGQYTTIDEIIQPAKDKKFVKAKFTGSYDGYETWQVIDTLIRIEPRRVETLKR